MHEPRSSSRNDQWLTSGCSVMYIHYGQTMVNDSTCANLVLALNDLRSPFIPDYMEVEVEKQVGMLLAS